MNHPFGIGLGAALGVVLVGWQQGWSTGRLAACAGTTFVVVDVLSVLLSRTRPGSLPRMALLLVGVVLWIGALALVARYVP